MVYSCPGFSPHVPSCLQEVSSHPSSPFLSVPRSYESLFVSVYSDTTMNIGHYIMGLIHYLILPLTIISETNGFMNHKKGMLYLYIPSYTFHIILGNFTLIDIEIRQWLGVAFFLYCNWEQHNIVWKMAKIRKAPDGLSPIDF